jgi:hypothetical protein
LYSLFDQGLVGQWGGLTNGTILHVFISNKGKSVVAKAAANAFKPSFVKQERIDELLLKESGVIKRGRNPQL